MRPVDKKYPITQRYGVSGDYAAGYHTGTDFGCPVGTPVKAPFHGIVTKKAYDDDYGHYLIIQGTRGNRAWLLAHLTVALVREGEKVERGETVARSGNSGNSSGPHLHAEERRPPFGYRDNQKPTAWDG